MKRMFFSSWLTILKALATEIADEVGEAVEMYLVARGIHPSVADAISKLIESVILAWGRDDQAFTPEQLVTNLIDAWESRPTA